MMSTRLLSLGLCREIYWSIYEVLNRYHKTDISDLEADIIIAMMSNKTLNDQMAELTDRMDRVDTRCSDVLDESSIAISTADQAKVEIDDIKLILQEKCLLDKLESIADNFNKDRSQFITDMTAKMDRLARQAKSITDSLTQIMDFIESEKTINLRATKKYNKKAILNLRNKLTEVRNITKELSE